MSFRAIWDILFFYYHIYIFKLLHELNHIPILNYSIVGQCEYDDI